MLPTIAGMASSKVRDQKLAQFIREAGTAANLKNTAEKDVYMRKSDDSPSKYEKAGALDRHRYHKRFEKAEKLEKLQALHDESKQLHNHLDEARFFHRTPSNMELGHELAKAKMESDVELWSNALGHVPELDWRLAYAKRQLENVRRKL